MRSFERRHLNRPSLYFISTRENTGLNQCLYCHHLCPAQCKKAATPLLACTFPMYRAMPYVVLVPETGIEPVRPLSGKRRILSPLCLPISPLGRSEDEILAWRFVASRELDEVSARLSYHACLTAIARMVSTWRAFSTGPQERNELDRCAGNAGRTSP